MWENGYKDKIHFDVYSSFEAYGWKERDKPYEEVFKTIREHDGMTYHGFKPNDVVRKALSEAHIFAYPSIWVETSCISAIEAMSAGVQIVCPNLGALLKRQVILLQCITGMKTCSFTLMYLQTFSKVQSITTRAKICYVN